MIIFALLILITVGYAYLSTTLNIEVNVKVPKYIEKIDLVTKIKEEAVLDNITSTYVTSSTGIDFTTVSSDNNGKGIYILNSAVNDENPIYYFRGAVDNNNVRFANFCWKIVRTTKTSGIKLIYNGAPNSDGSCTNTTGTTSTKYDDDTDCIQIDTQV